ncbi:structural protein [Heliothis armigera cypovirus 5]|uniref:Structural protein n=1 Tax=Heliothis armigera cypovirus 5 TaxID=332585 RepID=Q3LTV8_9REOV|nr:structural protein [Cypovirus 5]ABA10825.1 structural protein [Heliothis armigera cypovirus 5]
MDDYYTNRSIDGFKIGKSRMSATEFINTIDGIEIPNSHIIYKGIDTPKSEITRKAPRIYGINLGNEIMTNIVTPLALPDNEFSPLRIMKNIKDAETKPYISQSGWVTTVLSADNVLITSEHYMPMINHYIQLINAQRETDVADAMQVMENLAVCMNGVETHGSLGYDIILKDEFTDLKALARDIASWNWISFLVDLARNEGDARRLFIEKYEDELRCLMLICLINDSREIKTLRNKSEIRIRMSDFNHLRDGVRAKTFTYSRSGYALMAKFWQLTFELIDEVIVKEMGIANRIRFKHSTVNPKYSNKKTLTTTKPIKEIYEILGTNTEHFNLNERLAYISKLREVSKRMHTDVNVDYKKNTELYEQLRERITFERDQIEN